MPRTPPSGLFSASTTCPPTPSPESSRLERDSSMGGRPSFFSPYGWKARKLSDLRLALRHEVEILMQQHNYDYKTALQTQYNIESALLSDREMFSAEFLVEVSMRQSILQEMYVRAFVGMMAPQDPKCEVSGEMCLRR